MEENTEDHIMYEELSDGQLISRVDASLTELHGFLLRLRPTSEDDIYLLKEQVEVINSAQLYVHELELRAKRQQNKENLTKPGTHQTAWHSISRLLQFLPVHNRNYELIGDIHLIIFDSEGKCWELSRERLLKALEVSYALYQIKDEPIATQLKHPCIWELNRIEMNTKWHVESARDQPPGPHKE